MEADPQRDEPGDPVAAGDKNLSLLKIESQ